MRLGDKEVVEGLYQRLLEIRRKVYAGIEDIFKLLRKEPIDRISLAEVLAYLRSNIQALVVLIDSIGEYINKVNLEVGYQEMLRQLPEPLAVIFASLIAFSEQAKLMKYEFKQHTSNLRYIAEKLEQRYSSGNYIYSDDDIRIELYRETTSILEHIKVLGVRMESELYKMGYSTVKHLPMISVIDLITFHVGDWPGLDDKWVCAAIYLAALEVCVNKICSELGIKADTFKDRLNKLVQCMRKYGIEISRIEKDIVSRLYDHRCRVLHGGYIPTDEDLSYIINVIPKFIQTIKELRQKRPQ